jgi:aspartyl-tRNA synthetase
LFNECILSIKGKKKRKEENKGLNEKLYEIHTSPSKILRTCGVNPLPAVDTAHSPDN